MKRILLWLCLAVLLLAAVLSTASCGDSEGEEIVLYVYNWGEYISDGSEDSLDVNAAFEEYCRTVLGKNVRVNYSTYSDNESMYAKLSAGQVAYDIIVPSDYMIARLAKEGMLRELNLDNIPNYAYIEDDFKGMYYDPDQKYSVPYTYGTVGVIYNTEMVPEDEENLGSWELLWDPDYEYDILQFRNPRDAFATAQFLLGIDINSTDPADWERAAQKLAEQKERVSAAYVMDEIFNKMETGSAAIAPYYAGDYLTMYEQNEALAFYHPTEGTNIFVDAMCIPAASKNPELAELYINFMLSEEAAVANAEYICYASPNTLVKNNAEYQEYMGEEAMAILYDHADINKEYFHDLPEATLLQMNSLWEQLKIKSSTGTAVYVLSAVIVLAIVAAVIGFAVRNKRRAHYYNAYTEAQNKQA